MTTPPPVIAEKLYCPRCAKDCPKTEFVAVMRDVRPGAKARGLPLLTVWRHKPGGATRRRPGDYATPCAMSVYSLERA